MEKQWQHKDALTAARAQDEWQAKLEKYPSLKKVEEQGNDYVEVLRYRIIRESESQS
jgi:hypothetical protein